MIETPEAKRFADDERKDFYTGGCALHLLPATATHRFMQLLAALLPSFCDCRFLMCTVYFAGIFKKLFVDGSIQFSFLFPWNLLRGQKDLIQNVTWKNCSHCKMAKSSKSNKKQLSKNRMLNRPSTDMRDENLVTQHQMEDIHAPMLFGFKLPVFKSTKQNFVKNRMLVSNRRPAFLRAVSVVVAAKNSVLVSNREHAFVGGVSAATCSQVCDAAQFPNGSWPSAESFERTVKLIRKLETGCYITDDFRKKFLTWYGLRATEREHIVVSTFVHTLYDDPPCLAGQLIDSFSDIISRVP